MFQRHKAAKLQEAQHQHAVAELRQLTERLPDSNGFVSPDGLREFIEFAGSHGIDLGTVPDLRRTVRLGLATGGYFLETDTNLLLKRGETALLDASVSLLTEVKDREFRGGSRGVSVPLGHGIRYRAGAVRGQMVTVGSHWATADTGALTVTDQRVVYHGGRKTLEFPFSKLATLNVYTDAIDLGITSRQSTSTFATGDPELLAGIIHAAVDHRDADVTMIQMRTEP